MSTKNIEIHQSSFTEQQLVYPQSTKETDFIVSTSNRPYDSRTSVMFIDEKRVIQKRLAAIRDESRKKSLDEVAERLGIER